MRALALDDLWDFAIPSTPALSPDGQQIAYVVRTADRTKDRNRRALWLVDASGGVPVQLTAGWADTAPAWSPDGTRLAFLRAADGPAQVWLLPMGGGEPYLVTDLPLGAGPPVWSPDGRRIAFTAPVPGPGGGPERGPVVVDRLGYKADGLGLCRGVHRHLHVLDVASGDVRQLTSGEWDASAPAWSPDGSRLAFAAAMGPDADLTLTSAAYVVRADRTESPRPVGSAEGQVESVVWAPDGSGLVAVGKPTVRIGHTRLLWLAFDDGATADLTAAIDRDVMPGGPEWPGGAPQFTADGRSVLFCVRDRGATHLYRVELGGEKPQPVLTEPGVSVAGLSAASDVDMAAVVAVTGTSHGEIALMDPADGTFTVLTGVTRAALPEAEFVPIREREFVMADGTVVHGWLIRDPDASGPQPMLLDIHGGPHLAWGPYLEPAHPYHHVLAGQGWTVLLLNPRASDGYGESFYASSVGAWGTGDERDFLEPVDQLVAEGIADPDRLAVCGYSYGGFATCHLTTRTDRFAVAVTGGAVTDLVSMAGTSDLSRVFALLEFGGDVYSGRKLIRAQSPIERVEEVRTPTLVVHAMNDERCPVGQAEEWFTALRSLGVPSEMVLYPDESHQFMADGTPSARVDYSRQIVRWLVQHVTPEAADE